MILRLCPSEIDLSTIKALTIQRQRGGMLVAKVDTETAVATASIRIKDLGRGSLIRSRAAHIAERWAVGPE
jgi:hypothetical protein